MTYPADRVLPDIEAAKNLRAFVWGFYQAMEDRGTDIEIVRIHMFDTLLDYIEDAYEQGYKQGVEDGYRVE